MDTIKNVIAFFLFASLLYGCARVPEERNVDQEASFFQKVNEVPDSITAPGIVVYNLFKYQILAHAAHPYDSLLITNQVYKRHQKVWEELYAVLFNQEMFSTEAGMIAWNKELYSKQQDTIESKVNQLLEADFTQKLNYALQGLKKHTGRSPENVRLSIILAPFEGIGFGGMTNDAFVLDLLDANFDVLNMIEEGIPHELNHFIYDPTRENDPHKDTPLRLLIDEGFACYYTYKYFGGEISKAQAVEQMSTEDWQWYLDHEKEIYQACAPFFFYEGDEDPLRPLGEEMGAPATLFYWLGFRIVEAYVDKYGPDSWLDIYELPVKAVLEKSGYIDQL